MKSGMRQRSAELKAQALAGDLGPEIRVLAEYHEAIPRWRLVRRRRVGLRLFRLLYRRIV